MPSYCSVNFCVVVVLYNYKKMPLDFHLLDGKIVRLCFYLLKSFLKALRFNVTVSFK